MPIETNHDRTLLPDYNFFGPARRTKSGQILKNFTFYRAFNRDNLWNDPYHSSTRTWKAFHEVSQSDRLQRSRSTDAVDSFAYQDKIKRDFVANVRTNTRERLNRRREYNRLVATAAHLEPFAKLPHVRQDVCSGMTKPIGGNIDDLPLKALRNIMTPSIEKMDDDACVRLSKLLDKERKLEELHRVRINQRRSEIIEDRRRRHECISALEKLSGIRPRPRSHSHDRRESHDRIDALAVPRPNTSMGPQTCLDGLDLAHISHASAIEHLH